MHMNTDIFTVNEQQQLVEGAAVANWFHLKNRFNACFSILYSKHSYKNSNCLAPLDSVRVTVDCTVSFRKA